MTMRTIWHRNLTSLLPNFAYISNSLPYSLSSRKLWLHLPLKQVYSNYPKPFIVVLWCPFRLKRYGERSPEGFWKSFFAFKLETLKT